MPTLYHSRQTHTFNLNEGHFNGQTDGQTATTQANALGYIMLFFGSLSSFGRQSVLSLNRSHFAPVQLKENTPQ